MTLNESANPKQIDLDLIDTKGLRGAAVKLHGVYAFDNNKTVRIRLDPALEPLRRSRLTTMRWSG